jgi:hypothetical protein
MWQHGTATETRRIELLFSSYGSEARAYLPVSEEQSCVFSTYVCHIHSEDISV